MSPLNLMTIRWDPHVYRLILNTIVHDGGNWYPCITSSFTVNTDKDATERVTCLTDIPLKSDYL